MVDTLNEAMHIYIYVYGSIRQQLAHMFRALRGTNYNTDQAEQEMWHLYNSLTPDVKEAFGLIKNNKDGLSKYYEKNYSI